MFLSDLSIKRPIMVSMGLLVFLLFGTLAYFGMSLNLTPDVDIPYVTVQTIYAGAGPKEVETQVTKKIEDAVSSISKIDEMTSYSMESVSFVILKFELDKDVDIANQEVKDKIDAILNDLPDDSDRPIVQKFDIAEEPILDIILSGHLDITQLYDLADKRLKDRFAQLDGVARVDLTGGQEREVRVELDSRTVFQNSISLPQLAQILAAHNLDMPGGNFQKRTQEYSVRLKGEFDAVKTIEELEIPTAYGIKKLGHLAHVRDMGAEVRERTSYFNKENNIRDDNVVLMSLVKNAEGNTVKIARAVYEALPMLEKELPAGCKLTLATDKSIFIESSVNDTLTNIILGILLTGLVLLFFLHDLRSTIIVALSMPMSILSAFLFMQVSGFSLNMMSLMGLSTSVGILVANSIVVIENIFRHKEMGNNKKEAASKGTAEIVVAVVASTLTNIAVFLPIASMSSIVGMFFKEFALTVTYATIFSLVMSFTLTPMLASIILPEHDTKKHRIGEKLERLFHSWEKWYGKILEVLLKNKKRAGLVIVISIVLFIASFPIAGKVGFEFFPMTDEGDINIEVELPIGYNLDETASTLAEIEGRLTQHDEVKQIITTLGTISDINSGTNMAMVKLKLVDVNDRDIASSEAANLYIRELSEIPNASIRVLAVSSMGGGDRAPIQFTLMGQDVDSLEVYKNNITDRVMDIPGLVNLNSSSRAGKPEVTLIPDRQKIADAGLTVYDLAMTLRSAVTGLVTTYFKDQGEEYDIRIMMNEESIDTPEKIGNITVVGPAGAFRLSQLADIEFTEGFSKITHLDKFKSIEFTAASASGVPMGDVVNEIINRTADLQLPDGYKIQWGGMAEEMQTTVKDMLMTFLIALLLTYMLLAAILESLTQPLMILGTVPMALIGVFFAMFITGKTMNVISMMAIVMLLGIVVNNAILLLDYTNILVRQKGKDARTALIEACPTKLKPILMSSIAIILGMLPMAMGLGSAGREIRQPMGIVSIGGLVVSTVLALIVIPALYYLTSKNKKAVVVTKG